MTGHGDISSTLSDLERKLKDLEQELAGVGAEPGCEAGAPASAATPLVAAPAPDVVAPAPRAPAYESLHDVVIPAPSPAPVPLGDPAAGQLVADARQSPSAVHDQLGDLVRFREQLERSTRELMDEYTRLLDALQVPAPPPPPSAWSESSVRPAPAAAPLTVAAATPDPIAAPAPTPAGLSEADTVAFTGQVTVDAGPFTDIATLSAFEQALGHVSGAQDVYVRGFEGSRALIDLVLGEPVALGVELRRTAPVGFTITASKPDHVSITIDGGRHA
jgi:hypothetical protein